MIMSTRGRLEGESDLIIKGLVLTFLACLDGTLHVWSTNSNLARPDKSCETAHEKGSRTSGVVFARDGRRLATRGGDDTVKCEFSFPFQL